MKDPGFWSPLELTDEKNKIKNLTIMNSLFQFFQTEGCPT